MHRIVVAGSSGSGRSTVARQLSEILEMPYLELDSVFHQPELEPMPDEEFRAAVADFALQSEWVIDGNYASQGIKDLLWPVADTLVWLDLPKHVVMRRVIWQTLKRGVTSEKLWNENREPVSNFISLDPETSVVAWSWTRYDHVRKKYEAFLAEPDAVHLRVYRLMTTSEVDEFIAAVSGR